MGVDRYVVVPRMENEIYLADSDTPWRCAHLKREDNSFNSLHDDGVERKGKQAGPICAMTGTIDSPGHLRGSQRVIGWDPGRKVVTDFYWDGLPKLGYAKLYNGAMTLHYEIDDTLVPITMAYAKAHGLIDENNDPIRHGQPRVASIVTKPQCLYQTNVFTWDVFFDNGESGVIDLYVPEGISPPDDKYLIGKKQREINNWKPANLYEETETEDTLFKM
jgi:hypothetical protein